MTWLLDWLKPKNVDVPKIRPVLLDDIEPAVSPHPELDEAVRLERGKFMEEIARREHTVADVRMTLLRDTLGRQRGTS